jgi:hypothetical protein
MSLAGRDGGHQRAKCPATRQKKVLVNDCRVTVQPFYAAKLPLIPFKALQPHNNVGHLYN